MSARWRAAGERPGWQVHAASGLLALLLVLSVVAAGPRAAQGDPGLSEADFQRNLERWQAMGEEERAAIKARHAEWKQMTADEREALLADRERFQRKDPAEQQALAESHQSWARQAGAEERRRLKHRLELLNGLAPERRQRAMAVGYFLSEAGDEVRGTFRSADPERRQMAVRALRDLYNELPEERREQLRSMPHWRKRMVVRHIMSERRARMAALLERTLEVPAERFMLRELLAQLEPHERRTFNRLPQPLKRKLMMQLRQPKDEARQLQMLRHFLRRAAKQQRDPRQRPPRAPRGERRKDQEEERGE